MAAKKNEEMITFQLFKDNDRYKDDVFVAVNGKGYMIKRGVPVKMPQAVYEVLQNSMAQMLEVDKVVEDAMEEMSGGN